jgi:hypothetical protein
LVRFVVKASPKPQPGQQVSCTLTLAVLLWPVPLAVQQINAAVIARLIPHLTPARAHEQNIALLNLGLLGFGSVLEVFKGDPIIRREWVLALVFGHIK